MLYIEQIRAQAKKNPKRIILPEHEDIRVLKAAEIIAKEGLAKVTLLGKKDNLTVFAKSNSINLSGVEIIDPENFKDRDRIIDTFWQLRKHKGITPEKAKEAVLTNYVYYGAIMVRFGICDGFVAGASHTTPDVARAALYCLELDPVVRTMSGAFFMEVPNSPYGEKGAFIFADCGIMPEPSVNQLTGISIASADLFKKLTGKTPYVALLSYSTKGSAEGPLVEKVQDALAKIKNARPDLLVDGELQVDSALVPEVAKIKLKDSPVAGKANVLIFPNLDSGNISYKLVQRLANARAVGPLIQGATRPCSDLSRGCFVEDVVDAVAVTVVRSQ